MQNLSLPSTVPAAPPSPVVRLLPSLAGMHAVRRGWVRWWRVASRPWGSVQTALVPRKRPLDVEALGAHLQRDLNLHDNAEGWLQAQKAWRQYEHYRDLQAWRAPF